MSETEAVYMRRKETLSYIADGKPIPVSKIEDKFSNLDEILMKLPEEDLCNPDFLNKMEPVTSTEGNPETNEQKEDLDSWLASLL